MISEEQNPEVKDTQLDDSDPVIIPYSGQYDPHITKEQWKKFLEEVELPNHMGCGKMLKGLFMLGGEASPKRLADVYGGSPYSYNASATNIGRRAKNYFDIQPAMDNGSESLGSIPFIAHDISENGRTYCSFTIRKELLAALEETDLSEINPYVAAAWLLAWNKEKWNWDHYAEICGQTKNGNSFTRSWTCGHSGPQIGDEVFLFKTGDNPRGIVAHGKVIRTMYENEHYDPVKASAGEREKYIDVAFDRILNYETEPILSREVLNAECPGQQWSPRSSGIEIKNDILPQLHALWEETLAAEGTLTVKEAETMHRFAHNMILYGPPGTGKTYNSVIYAAAVCDGRSIEELKKEKYSDILARYRELKQEGRIAFSTFHQSYGYEEFIEGIKPRLDKGSGSIGYTISDGIFKAFCRKAEKDGTSDKPCVFIIDEINRGNISKIFGELITLIEDTKRAGAREAMEAVLPYSGETFSVPGNVYILGTMNTADRSIALLDTALRRRFSFIEMMPDGKVLESLGIGKIIIGDQTLNVAGMLEVMNRRIEFLFDREHTIGHAFFTRLMSGPSIEVLADIFEKSIIPLLQEYFYEDYEKIQLVLGDNAKEDQYKFILDRSAKIRDLFNGNPDLDQPETGYVIQKEAFLKPESYKLIGKDL